VFLSKIGLAYPESAPNENCKAGFALIEWMKE